MATPHVPHCETLLRTKPFMQHADGAIWGQYRGHKKSEKCDTNNVATAVSDVAYFGQAVEMQGAAKDCKVWQRDKPQRRQYLAELSNRGYECIKREYIAPIKRGAIAVFVDVGSSLSRWFRRREGCSRVFCFPTKEMNREERLSKSSFTRLPNVKGTVAEDARITGSPLRSELASVLREKMALSGHLIFLGQGKGSGDRR